MSRGGFTLVEVLVALVVLEVGLLGVAGTLLVAGRTLGRAERGERAVASMAWTLDSLAAGWSPGQGRDSLAWGTLEWTVAADGSVRLRALLTDDTLDLASRLGGGR